MNKLFLILLLGLFIIPVALATTGGILTHDGGYDIRTFKSDDTFGLDAPLACAEVLIVAGGGAGGHAGGGGGGAGGVLYIPCFNFTQNVSVMVGVGGTVGTNALNGSLSAVGAYSAPGGGGGGSTTNPYEPGKVGGSGGGDGYTNSGGAPKIVPFGNDGGSGNVADICGGGGGGYGSEGLDVAGSHLGGLGGNGYNFTISGNTSCYAGGGSGGCYHTAGSLSAAGCFAGVGGAGALGAATDAVNFTGSGGGGGSCDSATCNGGRGGTGIVIIRYALCTPSWSCSAYDTCNSSNILPCLNVTDTNSCGSAFGGSLNTYDGSCTFYAAPAWVQYPPNISANKSQVVTIQLNLTGANLTYALNDSAGGSITPGGLLTANTAAAGFWNLKANVSNPGGSVTGLFWLNVSCFPAWSCSSFTDCSNASWHTCLAVADLNACGENFTGNVSAYDGACTYTPPGAPSVGDFKDLHTAQGIAFLFILVFFWLAMLVISLVFRNFATASLMWLSGVLIGFLLYQFGAVAAIGFLLLDTAVFLGIGKLRG